MKIKETTIIHSAWVGAMGWHDKRMLEYLGLIASEIGEAADEAPGNQITDKFGSEVIDIVLRVIDCAYMHGVNLLAESQLLLGNPKTSLDRESLSFSDLAHFAAMSTSFGPRPEETVREQLLAMMPDLARAMNDCRGATLSSTFGMHLTKVFLGALQLAHRYGINVDATIQAKIEKNALKGNRGRLV